MISEKRSGDNNKRKSSVGFFATKLEQKIHDKFKLEILKRKEIQDSIYKETLSKVARM